MHIRALITALGLNAVPAAGWFLGEWSAGTMLVLYWLETLIGTLLVAVRIALHRRAVPAQGHWAYEAPKGAERQAGSHGSTYLTAFLLPALVFTFAHGFFLAVLGLVVFSKKATPEGALEPKPPARRPDRHRDFSGHRFRRGPHLAAVAAVCLD